MRAIPASQSCHVLLELWISAAAPVCVSPAAARRDRIASGDGESVQDGMEASTLRDDIWRNGELVVDMRAVLS